MNLYKINVTRVHPVSNMSLLHSGYVAAHTPVEAINLYMQKYGEITTTDKIDMHQVEADFVEAKMPDVAHEIQ